MGGSDPPPLRKVSVRFPTVLTCQSAYRGPSPGDLPATGSGAPRRTWPSQTGGGMGALNLVVSYLFGVLVGLMIPFLVGQNRRRHGG